MITDENRTVDKRKMKKILKSYQQKCALFGMHLIYTCHNNDEVSDLNQGNAFCYVGIIWAHSLS